MSENILQKKKKERKKLFYWSNPSESQSCLIWVLPNTLKYFQRYYLWYNLNVLHKAHYLSLERILTNSLSGKLYKYFKNSDILEAIFLKSKCNVEHNN